MKFAAKDLERNAKKCEKDAVTEQQKLKRVIDLTRVIYHLVN